jgi:hypothetical protein
MAERGEPLRNAVPMERLTIENRENHEVERALRNIELVHAEALL